jgi:hypothetical protein
MSALGQKRTFAVQQRMSAKCQKQTSTVGSGIWAFALGDGRISLKVGTPSGSYVRVMKDRLATIYAKVLFFSTRPFKNEFQPRMSRVIRALRYLRFAGVT